MADFDRLSPRQRRAIAALVSAKDNRSAAEAAGVGERTLYRWLSEPAFKAGLHDAEAALVTANERSLLALLHEAIDVLSAVMRSNKPADQLRAACSILDFMLKFRALSIEARLAALEEKVYDNS